MNNQIQLETYILENNINDYQLILNNFKYDENYLDENKLLLFLLQNEKYDFLELFIKFKNTNIYYVNFIDIFEYIIVNKNIKSLDYIYNIHNIYFYISFEEIIYLCVNNHNFEIIKYILNHDLINFEKINCLNIFDIKYVNDYECMELIINKVNYIELYIGHKVRNNNFITYEDFNHLDENVFELIVNYLYNNPYNDKYNNKYNQINSYNFTNNYTYNNENKININKFNIILNLYKDENDKNKKIFIDNYLVKSFLNNNTELFSYIFTTYKYDIDSLYDIIPSNEKRIFVNKLKLFLNKEFHNIIFNNTSNYIDKLSVKNDEIDVYVIYILLYNNEYVLLEKILDKFVKETNYILNNKIFNTNLTEFCNDITFKMKYGGIKKEALHVIFEKLQINKKLKIFMKSYIYMVIHHNYEDLLDDLLDEIKNKNNYTQQEKMYIENEIINQIINFTQKVLYDTLYCYDYDIMLKYINKMEDYQIKNKIKKSIKVNKIDIIFIEKYYINNDTFLEEKMDILINKKLYNDLYNIDYISKEKIKTNNLLINKIKNFLQTKNNKKISDFIFNYLYIVDDKVDIFKKLLEVDDEIKEIIMDNLFKNVNTLMSKLFQNINTILIKEKDINFIEYIFNDILNEKLNIENYYHVLKIIIDKKYYKLLNKFNYLVYQDIKLKNKNDKNKKILKTINYILELCLNNFNVIIFEWILNNKFYYIDKHEILKYFYNNFYIDHYNTNYNLKIIHFFMYLNNYLREYDEDKENNYILDKTNYIGIENYEYKVIDIIKIIFKILTFIDNNKFNWNTNSYCILYITFKNLNNQILNFIENMHIDYNYYLKLNYDNVMINFIKNIDYNECLKLKGYLFYYLLNNNYINKDEILCICKKFNINDIEYINNQLINYIYIEIDKNYDENIEEIKNYHIYYGLFLLPIEYIIELKNIGFEIKFDDLALEWIVNKDKDKDNIENLFNKLEQFIHHNLYEINNNIINIFIKYYQKTNIDIETKIDNLIENITYFVNKYNIKIEISSLKLVANTEYKELFDYLRTISNIDLKENNEELFLDVCIKNNIDFVKYLYEIEPNFNLSIDENNIFYQVCRVGALDTLKWLTPKFTDLDDVNKYNNGIYNAVSGGHVEVFIWLINNIEDIKIKYDEIEIILVCINYYNYNKNEKYIEIINYINELKDEDEKYIILQKKVNNDIFLHNIDLYDTKKVENIEKCAICYEESNIITNCNHQFCLLCINENYRYNKNFDYICSYCRSENIEIFKIINNNI
jgi:hypothetical protein